MSQELDIASKTIPLEMIKTLPLSAFKPEWLKRRIRICALPTEFVYPCRYTHNVFDIVPDFAYGYRLSDEEMEPVTDVGKVYTWYKRWVAIELHENYGSDGHVEYVFQNLFFLVLEDEVPKDTKEYVELTRKYYDEQRSKRDTNSLPTG